MSAIGTISHASRFLMPEVVFGETVRQHAGRYAANFSARKVLLVTDPGIIESRILDIVIHSLDSQEIDYVTFDDVSPNPRIHQAEKGALKYQEQSCDLIMAVGGGSPMDCAKTIGILVTNGGKVTDYEGIEKVHKPLPPLIFVPTTSGSSADVSRFAIINNQIEKRKMAIISTAIIPDVALIDPETLLTMDSALTSSTVMDALTHAIEGFVSLSSSGLTEYNSLEAIRLIGKYFPRCKREPDNIYYRYKLMMASYLAGLSFSNAGLGAVHAVSHALGGLLDLPHGWCNAAMLKYIIRYNYQLAERKYEKINNALSDFDETDSSNTGLIHRVEALLDTAEIDPHLSKAGVLGDDISDLAMKAYYDPCMVTNPRKPELQDVETLYEEAL